LESHTNCGHEGTNNGVKKCSSPVMPQNRLDRAIKTLTLNAEIKAINTSIKVCEKTNQRKLWSDTPTSGHVTDPCESMLCTEWKFSTDWIPHQVSQQRWLVIHHSKTKLSNLDGWSDEELVSSEEEEEEETAVATQDHGCEKKQTFGPIPCFTRVFEVKVCVVSQVFRCTCCNQERMGLPCHHIASVCCGNDSILGKDSTGFPLTSICVFWWNQYYLYGMSSKDDQSKVQGGDGGIG
jgi:hypothetical protein